MVKFSEFFNRDSELSITTSNATIFRDLLVGLDPTDSGVDIQILTDEDTVTELRDQFLTTTHLIEQIEEDTIELRSQSSSLPTFIITNDSITTITGFPNSQPTALNTSEQPFLDQTKEEFNTLFDAASHVRFRTPSYSLMMETLGEQFDREIQSDFETALRGAKEPGQLALSLDPVLISILIGGYHKITFYELSRWGENCKLASRAKFSRMKSQLEEAGLTDIEKVPVDVGRPRHRLLLGGELDNKGDIEEVIATTTREFPE